MSRPTLFPRVACLTALVALAACREKAVEVDFAGQPSNLQMMSGDAQIGTPGQVLASPLTVKLMDDQGNPVAAREIRWSATGGSIPAVDTTRNDGTSFVSWKLPASTGMDTAHATIQGLGTVQFVATTRAVAGDFTFRYVDVGTYHACAILTTEKGVCWGFNTDGQLGVGDSSGTIDVAEAPVLSAADLSFRITSAGRYHTCGVTLGGQAYCWGNGADGRIGMLGSSRTPVAVKASTGVQLTFRSATTGLLHSCGLTTSQQVWCWGYNGEGELGSGSGFQPGDFSAAATLVGGNYRTVSAGGMHTCALTTSGGAECWGYNASGQLGDGTNTTSGVPVTVQGGFTFLTDPAVVPHAPDPDFYVPANGSLSAGYAHTCAIRTNGQAVCWGVNQDGQLGNSSTTSSSTPVAVAGGLTFTRLAAGYRHTCGIASNGSAYCWGANESGQLGDGSNSPHLTPVQVAGGFTWQSISAGELSTCGVTTQGTAYCWGDNEYGQLGTGGRASVNAPAKVVTQ